MGCQDVGWGGARQHEGMNASSGSLATDCPSNRDVVAGHGLSWNFFNAISRHMMQVIVAIDMKLKNMVYFVLRF